MTTLFILGLLAATPPMQAVERLPWPAGSVEPAAVDGRLSLGPSAAAVSGDATWLHDLRAHQFVRLGADGRISARVDSHGHAHAFIARADGGLAYLDQARRLVVVVDAQGHIIRSQRLPAGLRTARRLVELEGRLHVHTAYQETFRVPEAGADGLKPWFLGRREGLLFPDAEGTGAAATVEGGRARLLLHDPPTGLSTGDVPPRIVHVTGLPELLSVEIVGAADGAFWLRVTQGARAQARDSLALVGDDGGLRWQSPPLGERALSWADTAWPLTGPEPGIVSLRPTLDGVERRTWRVR